MRVTVLVLTFLALLVPMTVDAAHCRCEITCTAADGKTFTRTNSPFPDYTQGLESERNRCESSCNQWVGSSIQSWSEQESICGGVRCSGTSHVGDEPRRRWKNVAGAEHNRTCCPAASNGQGCPPMVCTDITSVFRLTQSTDVTSRYDLFYDRALNPCLDSAFQAYANYVTTQIPGMTHMWVGYRIDILAPDPPGQIGWFAVQYTTVPQGSQVGVPTSSMINVSSMQPAPPAPHLQVNKNYRVTRGLFFNNAQDQNLPHFGDPSCTLPSFTIRISVTAPRAGAPRGSADSRAIATMSVEGQPDRQVAIEAETPAERDRRLRLEPVTVPEQPKALRLPRQ